MSSKKLREALLSAVIVSSLGLATTTSALAVDSTKIVSASEEQDVKGLNYFDIIKIADPYIEKVGLYYSITDPGKLKSLLGQEAFLAVEQRIEKANLEIFEASHKDAVTFTHMDILRANGNRVDAEWWGKRIWTYGRENTIKTRKIATTFSQNSDKKAITARLLSIGIRFIPGYGSVGSVALSIVGIWNTADAITWNKVATGIMNKLDASKYYLKIDVNAWDMEVKVYEQ